MLMRLFAAARGLLYASVFVLLWWWVVDMALPLDDRLAFSLLGWLRVPGFVVPYEEPHLEQRFGQSYARYKSSVNRWWPRKPTHTVDGSVG